MKNDNYVNTAKWRPSWIFRTFLKGSSLLYLWSSHCSVAVPAVIVAISFIYVFYIIILGLSVLCSSRISEQCQNHFEHSRKYSECRNHNQFGTIMNFGNIPRFETIVPRNHYEHRNFLTNGGPYALRFSGNGQKCPSNFEKPQVPHE